MHIASVSVRGTHKWVMQFLIQQSNTEVKVGRHMTYRPPIP